MTDMSAPTPEEFATAVKRVTDSRQSHLDWIEHMEQGCCEADPTYLGDVDYQRNIVAEYDQVLDVLDRAAAAVWTTGYVPLQTCSMCGGDGARKSESGARLSGSCRNCSGRGVVPDWPLRRAPTDAEMASIREEAAQRFADSPGNRHRIPDEVARLRRRSNNDEEQR